MLDLQHVDIRTSHCKAILFAEGGQALRVATRPTPRARGRSGAHLVLHGGLGVPAEMVAATSRLPGGGVSKVNIATNLDLAALEALGRAERISDAEMSALPARERALAQAAVEDKIRHYLGSNGQADSATWREVVAAA